MASFRPFKNYIMYLMDTLVQKYSMQEPFLDVGCGQGDVSLYFAKKGWAGKGIDVSEEAIVLAKKALSEYPNVSVEHKDVSHLDGKYNTIFLCDVLEHVDNDTEFLQNVKKMAHNGRAGTYLVVTVPVFKKEWRWDDEFYGHIRRYEIPELTNLLEATGFKVLDIWDCTFPFFWLLRRLYTFIFPKKMILRKSRKDLSEKSSIDGSWDRGIVTAIAERLIYWKLVFYIQSRLKERIRGFECILVAKYAE